MSTEPMDEEKVAACVQAVKVAVSLPYGAGRDILVKQAHALWVQLSPNEADAANTRIVRLALTGKESA